ncbi:MAG TPA: 30S ribosomal protein S4 [Candidatus Paceibacterota bacterium]|nr:30S ribosomal protein S4 [Candidatus Paceibacterota bacterium]HRZ34543.1 30S ribosomal protein S4 [Candidatus Paceibacterota bacterium]
MKIGPRYKIARRLGSAVFEKTQTAKYALRAEKKSISTAGVRGQSNYGAQLIEKQKARFTYGITAKQLKNYVRSVISSKVKDPEARLYNMLEKRLDNVVLRSGLASTRQQARQIVTHGHMKINDKKTTVPSIQVKKGDAVTVKESKRISPLYTGFKDKAKENQAPAWLSVNAEKFLIEIVGEPEYKASNLSFNLGEVIQFYKR